MSLSDFESCRQRLEACEERYRRSVEAHAEAVEGGDAAAVAEAAARRDAAREEFSRALRAFSDLVIRGKSPGPTGYS